LKWEKNKEKKIYTDLCWKWAEKVFENYISRKYFIFLGYVYFQLCFTILLADLAETADPETATLATVQLFQQAEILAI
jgi:hypothetical protein